MGFWTAFLTTLGIIRRRVSILILGLDNSGKTTIIAHFIRASSVPAAPSPNSPPPIVPTVGFSLEKFDYENLNFTVFDMSGQGRYRELWKHYYDDTDGLVWVLDAGDKERMAVVRKELWTVLSHKVLQQKKIPIVFFANKMDLEGSLTPQECIAALGLEEIRDRTWNIMWVPLCGLE
ncbi:hypothetical protein SpCBS45565_g00069 [Spizellomyces sp. 'palustris']|nr:hypothetical protein SpCBS45565_g00069 [Spizellomyces sp. 'palustris']